MTHSPNIEVTAEKVCRVWPTAENAFSYHRRYNDKRLHSQVVLSAQKIVSFWGYHSQFKSSSLLNIANSQKLGYFHRETCGFLIIRIFRGNSRPTGTGERNCCATFNNPGFATLSALVLTRLLCNWLSCCYLLDIRYPR